MAATTASMIAVTIATAAVVVADSKAARRNTAKRRD